MKIPFPDGGRQPGSLPEFSAPGVEPARDFTGSALQTVGEGVQRAASAVQTIEALHDAARVNEAEGALGDALTEHLYNPETGYLGKIGQDAIHGQREDSLRKVTEKMVSIRNGLANGRQRDDFEAVARRKMARAEIDASEWKAKQTVAYAIGTEDSLVKQRAMDAARTAGKPEFDEHLAAMGEARDRLTTLQGFAPDSPFGTLRRLEETTAVHGSAIQSMVAGGRVGDAVAHLAKYGAQIKPEERAHLDKVVQRASDDSIALDVAIRMEQSGMPLMAQRAQLLEERKAGKLTDAQFEGAWHRMRQTDAEVFQQQQQVKAELLNNAKNTLMRTGGTFASLDPETKQALVDAKLDGIVRGYEMGKSPKMTAVGMHFRYFASDDEIRGLSEEQIITTLSGHMSEDDIGAIATRWKTLTGRGTEEDAVKQDVDALIRLGAKDAGYLPELRIGATMASLDDADAEKLTRYGIDVRNRVRANLKPGEKPTTQHYRDAIEELKGERLKDGPPISLATRDELQAGSFETSFGDVDVQHLVGLDGRGTPEAMRILADLQADEDAAAAAGRRRPRKMTMRDAFEEFARQAQQKNVQNEKDVQDRRARGLDHFAQMYRTMAASEQSPGDPFEAHEALVQRIITQEIRGDWTPFGRVKTTRRDNPMIGTYGLTAEEVRAALDKASGLDVETRKRDEIRRRFGEATMRAVTR